MQLVLSTLEALALTPSSTNTNQPQQNNLTRKRAKTKKRYFTKEYIQMCKETLRRLFHIISHRENTSKTTVRHYTFIRMAKERTATASDASEGTNKLED